MPAERPDGRIPELERYTKKNEPFEKTFSPRVELSEAARLPSPERKEAIAAFKEKLAAQSRAWAECRNAIEARLEKDPDTPPEEISGIIDGFKAAFGFTERQTRAAHRAYASFAQERARMLELREQYPDDRVLIRDLTGVTVRPDATISISTGPMQFDIVADPVTAHMLYTRSPGILNADPPYGGFAHYKSDRDPVNFSVMRADKGNTPEIITHELQHHKNRVFQALFDKNSSHWEQQVLREDYAAETDPAKREAVLEHLFETAASDALNRVKDEIFAYKSDGGDTTRLADRFTAPGSDSYDYLRPLREERTDPQWQKLSQRVLIDRYQKQVRDGVRAFNELERTEGAKRAVALLTDGAVSDWPKLVARLMTSGAESVTAADVLAAAEKREQAAVRRRLLERRGMNAAAAVAGGTLGYEITHMPDHEHEVHEGFANMERVETGSASYRILHSSPLEPVNAEAIAGVDAVVLSIPEIQSAYAAAAVTEGERGNVSWRHEQLSELDRAIQWLAGISREPSARYHDLVARAVSEGIPLYIGDMISANEVESYTDTRERRADALVESGMGVALAASGAQELHNPSRRRLLRGLGKLAASSWLMSPLTNSFRVIDHREPDLGSTAYRLAEKEKAASNALHPELDSGSDSVRSTLVAQKAETLGRWLTKKLGKKPELLLVIGDGQEAVARDLQRPEEERVLELRKAFGSSFPIEGKIFKVASQDGALRGAEFTDEAFQ